MVQEISELENGAVRVKVRSRRGTGTRDQDEVIVEAVFDDLDQAENQSERVNQLVQERMEDAREIEASQGTETLGEQDSEVSKVYLGKGAELSGWIPLPKQIVFREIAPLASKNPAEDDLQGIKMNFSEDVPISGWQEVDAEIVSEEIEPLVRKHRLDTE